MAKFTSTAALNMRLPVLVEINGAAGATHRIPDAYVEEFDALYASNIPGFAWVTQDETTSLASSVHSHAQSSVTNLTSDLAAKFDKAGGVITGAVTVTSTFVAQQIGGTIYADQYSSLQAAIDALPASGGRVALGPSTYTLSAALTITGKTAVMLEGVGDKSHIDGSALGAGVHAISVSGSDVVLRNFKVSAPTASGSGDAIRFNAGASQGTVDGVTVSGGLNGITFSSAVRGRVSGCRITSSTQSTGGYGVLVSGAAHGVRISDNDLVSCRIGAGVVDSSSYAVVSGNHVSACTWIGISLDGDAGTLTGGYNQVVGNTIISCGTDSTANSDYGGIFIGESRENVISGNLCKGSIWHGIRMITSANGNALVGNQCTDNTKSGILVSTSDDVSIIGNVCENNSEYGIDLFTSTRPHVVGNRAETNGLHGIRVSGSSLNAYLQANICHNNTSYGINIASTSVSSTHVGHNSFASNSGGDVLDAGTSTRRDDLVATGRVWHGLINGTHTTQTATSNRVYLLPVMVAHRTRFDRVRFQVVTSSGSCQVGLYNASLARIATSGTSACPTAGVGSVVFTASVDVDPGLYYVALQFDNATASVIFISDNIGTMISMGFNDPGSFGLPATISVSNLGSSALKALITNA